MAAIQDLVLTSCPRIHCFTTKETENLDVCIRSPCLVDTCRNHNCSRNREER